MSDRIAPALRDGLERAMCDVLADPSLDGDHRVFFYLISDRLANGSYRGNGMWVRDLREGGSNVDAVFDRLQNTLNSNESFHMDDTFRMELMVVRPPDRRGRGRKQKNKPGYQKVKDLVVNKHTILRIKNRDDLCGARAIVTAKAMMDEKTQKQRDPNYHDPRLQRIRKGSKIQEVLAKELHCEAVSPREASAVKSLLNFSNTSVKNIG